MKQMKIIIAGSRDISRSDFSDIMFSDTPQKIIYEYPGNEIEIVSGHAKGVDTFGEEWARRNELPIKTFPADWAKYGKSAGPLRNGQMADYADMLIAIWDGKSRGTRDMINKMLDRGKETHVYVVIE